MQRLLAESTHFRALKAYSVAIITTALAVWARYLIDRHVDDECPFSLFYLSVLLTAWIAGSGPAFFAVVLGTASAAYFFIKPQSSMAIDSVAEVLQLCIYVLVNCVAALLFDRLHRQRQLAEQRSRDNELLSLSLREADERKDEFLALLAHELRNPLAPIRSGLEILERESRSPETVHRVQRVIERQSNHLVRLTNDLLDVSRFSRGKLELQVAELDLREAIDDAIEMTTGEFAERSHRFQRLVPDRPIWVEGDRVRLAQLTANLLGNAAKYTPQGGRVVLELEPSCTHVSLTVRDNGIGFPPEEARNILEPFRQMDTSRTREYGGLGLGLSIVKRLAELHGGKLVAESGGPGRGSCFTVTIPVIAEARANPRPALPEARVRRPGTKPGGAPRRLLVVEDGPDAADLLRELLESEGYLVDLARDGVSALQQVATEMPDVCIMDIGLPGMDGYELARRIRRMEHSSEMRLIAVTGWGSEADRQLSNEAGFDVHLVKPIVYSELLHQIETVLKAAPRPAAASTPAACG
jgi:two-component system, sensor histidine kinase